MRHRLPVPLKRFFLIFTILSYMLVCLPIFPIFYLSPHKYRHINAKIVSFFSRLLLWILGVKFHVNVPVARLKKNYLIVANHLSYLDVLIISSFFPGCFVTSREIRASAFLGQICMLAGCLFVERRSRQFLRLETADIARALEKGLNVIIFPEGTSTNGRDILRFRQPLFRAAIDADISILPVSISYTRINRQPVDSSNRDTLFWYGDMAFWPHFKALARVKQIMVTLHIGHPIAPSDGDSCAILSVTARTAVKKNYTPVLN